MSQTGKDSSAKDCYPPLDSRLKRQISARETTDEGCPVLEEIGTVCGETNNLNIFKEFRQLYDECMKKFEDSDEYASTLKKLAPLRKFIEDLWEQNALLVETVEELEQEATCRVTNLQDRLNRSCQKMCEYKEDINSLVELLRRCPKSDLKGIKFNTVNPTLDLQSSCKSAQDVVATPSPYECEANVLRKSKVPQNAQCSSTQFRRVENLHEEDAENKCKSKNDYPRHFNTRSACCIREKVSDRCFEDSREDYMERDNRMNESIDSCYNYKCEDLVDRIHINLKLRSNGGNVCDCGCSCLLDSDDASDN